jgi:hypothetical protein
MAIEIIPKISHFILKLNGTHIYDKLIGIQILPEIKLVKYY